MDPTRRKLYTYGAIVALYALVFGWWLFFFAHQSEFLMRRLTRAGIALPDEAELALRQATDESMQMFIFEGLFLGLMLLASVFLVVRSLQREVALHRQQRNFLSAVTHELRSPIASARLYIESLLLGRAEGDKRERYLRRAHADLDRLNAMVEDLLQSARLAKTGPKVSPEHVELGDQLQHIVDELSRDPQTSAATVELESGEPLRIDADPAALHTILRNLVANSVKYAGPKPRVRISARHAGDEVVLLVRDWGPGLQAGDSKRIFQAFVRGGEEIVRTHQGVGLGLYLVAELVRAQGGDVRALENVEGGGFAVEISLPASKEGSAA